MKRDLIEKTEAFLRKTFAESGCAEDIREYRIEHSYRVANIGRSIAEKEGFDETELVIACLLHDIAYAFPFKDTEDWKNHGRKGAVLVRPFLLSLGMKEDRIEDICYGIAVHVDGKADFEGKETAFAKTVSDADNIDHFDALRIFENLAFSSFFELDREKRKAHVISVLEKLNTYYAEELATKTATALWKDRVSFYISFYERLLSQLENSGGIL